MATNPSYVFPTVEEVAFLHHVEVTYFTPEECDKIIQLGTAGKLEAASVGGNSQRIFDENLRKSNVFWIEHNHNENGWLWDRLAHLTQEINKRHYNFRLVGFLECIQFTEYDGGASHYTWHMDYGAGSIGRRKMSICIQLSDPSDYVGGNLEFFYSSAPIAAGRSRGTCILFPSYTMHRVTPIVTGKRYSLVLWASGLESYR